MASVALKSEVLPLKQRNVPNMELLVVELGTGKLGVGSWEDKVDSAMTVNVE
jgi:hypothetical protein